MKITHLGTHLKFGKRAGLTLLESMIALSVMLLVSGTLVLAMSSMGGLADSTSGRANLQTMADDALFDIVADMRRTGTITSAALGVQFPYVFNGGVPAAGLEDHAHPPATNGADAGDPDAGPDREVIFMLPADADGDGRPDVDGAGDLVWSPDLISYTVQTSASQINYLERRVNGLNPVKVGSYVERLVVDNAASSGFTIPINSVRVRLFFRKLDRNGNLMRYSNEAVVALRNEGAEI